MSDRRFFTCATVDDHAPGGGNTKRFAVLLDGVNEVRGGPASN